MNQPLTHAETIAKLQASINKTKEAIEKSKFIVNINIKKK